MRGFVLGALVLVALDVVLTGQGPARVGGVFGAVTGWLVKWMDPAVPLVPDHRQPTTTSAASAGQTAAARAAAAAANVVSRLPVLPLP